jgi:two-component system, OmpR family, sensor histidine kinase MprB
MSLRSRWALTLTLVAALAIGLAVVASLVFTENQLRREIDEDLRARAEAAPEDLRDLLRQNYGRFGNRGARSVRLDAIVQILTPDGQIVGFEGAPQLPVGEGDQALIEGAGRPMLRTVTVEGARYRMITAHLDRPRLEGAVQVAVEVSSVDRSIAFLRRRLTVVWIGASLLAGAAGWWLARRAVTPIERLTATAEHVAATEQLDVGLDTSAPAEIGRLASSFQAMLSTLQSSRIQQRQLASDAGHELRTPLTALRTNLETLRRRNGDLSPEQRRELVDAALTEVAELSTLSAELVDLASDVTRSEEMVADVDLGELVGRVAERFRRRTDRQIIVTGTGSALALRPLQLERAVSNLVDNALKWSPDHAIVEITLDGPSVKVRDHGPGIPDDDLPHVFGRFYRSLEARTTPGSGLGLAIVKLIVESHGGTVTAANHPEGGALVGFTLPHEAPMPNAERRTQNA